MFDNHTIDAPDNRDVIILGAGVSGLVAASILLRKGAGRILLVDDYTRVGGNHIDISVGPYTFDIGSFVFQDDSPLLSHFPELLPLYVGIEPTWARLNPQGLITKYPISLRDDVVKAGPIEWARIAASVLFARAFHRKLANARDFARYWIGARFLRRSGLEHYLERFYGLPSDQVELKFAEKRMMWIREYASLQNPMFKRRKTHSVQFPKNRQLARPREGFDFLYRAAIPALQARGADIVLGAGLASIERGQDGFVIESGKGKFTAKRVVSTLPLNQTLSLCRLPAEAKLQTVRLISLLYSFAGRRGFDASILYNFSHGGAWKRLTVYSDFYGRVDGREYFAAEVSSHLAGTVEIADRDFREHTTANHLFEGDLRLEGSHSLANAYPVYTDGATQCAEEAVAQLAAFGIDSIGRQGRFDYQPTARDTTLKAERALEESERAAAAERG